VKRELTVQVGADGVLALRVPLGHDGANKTVRVVVQTVEEAAGVQVRSSEEWQRFIQEMAGRITDPTFDRPPQGDYEQREPLA
jgi:hypothetical protein